MTVSTKFTAKYVNGQGKEFPVKQAGNRFSYFSPKALRWLPVAKSKVTFA